MATWRSWRSRALEHESESVYDHCSYKSTDFKTVELAKVICKGGSGLSKSKFYTFYGQFFGRFLETRIHCPTVSVSLSVSVNKISPERLEK